MKNLFIVFCLLFSLSSCTEEIIEKSEVPADIKAIQKSLVGDWQTHQFILNLVPDLASEEGLVAYTYNDLNICETLASFESEYALNVDIIDHYSITLKNDILTVEKTYKCSGDTETVYWQIEKATDDYLTQYLIIEKDEDSNVLSVYKSMESSGLTLEAQYDRIQAPLTVLKYRLEMSKE